MGLEHHAPLHGKAIIPEAIPEAVLFTAEFEQLALMGQKAQVPAHVEAEDRHPERRQMAGRPQHRAIPPQHQGQIGERFLSGQQTWKWIRVKAALGRHHMGSLAA